MYTASTPTPGSKDLSISRYYTIYTVIDILEYPTPIPWNGLHISLFQTSFSNNKQQINLKWSQHTEIYANQIARSFLAILHWPSFSTTGAKHHTEMKLCQSSRCRTVEIKARHEEDHFQ